MKRNFPLLFYIIYTAWMFGFSITPNSNSQVVDVWIRNGWRRRECLPPRHSFFAAGLCPAQVRLGSDLFDRRLRRVQT